MDASPSQRLCVKAKPRTRVPYQLFRTQSRLSQAAEGRMHRQTREPWPRCWTGSILNCFLHTMVTIRALASARGSVATRRVATGPRARRARGQRARPLEGPKGPRVAKTCESEGPKGPRTSKAECPSRCLPVLLYVFHNSAQNREIHGPFSRP